MCQFPLKLCNSKHDFFVFCDDISKYSYIKLTLSRTLETFQEQTNLNWFSKENEQ